MVSKIIALLTAFLAWLETREAQRNPRRHEELEAEAEKIKKEIIALEWAGSPHSRGALRILRLRLQYVTRQLRNLSTGNTPADQRGED